MYKLLIFVIVCASIGLTACSVERLPGVYRMDIQQGNVVTQEMLSQLKLGMSKEQVSFVLGNPLLVDTFQPDRWHYIYSFKPGNSHRTQRTIIVWFEEDKLVRLSGNVKPNAQINSGKTEQTVSIEVPPRQTSESFLSRLINKLGFGSRTGVDTQRDGPPPKTSPPSTLPKGGLP